MLNSSDTLEAQTRSHTQSATATAAPVDRNNTSSTAPPGGSGTGASPGNSIRGGSGGGGVAGRERDTRSKATEAEIGELLSQVGRDLEPWKGSGGISLEMVEKVYCMESVGESMRIQVGIARPCICQPSHNS